MSTRRAARVTTTAAGRPRYLGNELPPELAAGPCIEDWTPTAPLPRYISEADRAAVRAARALREWSAAVTEWAEVTGWAREDRPANRAKDLARTRWPWSREYLTGIGEAALVDYYEGRADEHPGRPSSGWQASY